MSTLHTSRPSPRDLLKAIDQLDTSDLQPFVSQVLAQTARRLAPHVDGRESELLERVNQGRPPETEKRYRELIAARQAEALSAGEMEEYRSLRIRFLRKTAGDR